MGHVLRHVLNKGLEGLLKEAENENNSKDFGRRKMSSPTAEVQKTDRS